MCIEPGTWPAPYSADGRVSRTTAPVSCSAATCAGVSAGGAGSSASALEPSRFICTSREKYAGASGRSAVVSATNSSRDIGRSA